MTVMVVTLSTLLALSDIDFLVAVGAMGAFLCSPLFFILPGAALLRELPVEGNGNHEQLPSSSLLAVNPPTTEQTNTTDGPLLSQGATCAAVAMGLWLVAVGVVTFVISVWVFVTR